MRRTLADHTAVARSELADDVHFAVLADRRSRLDRRGMIRPKLLVAHPDRVAIHRHPLRPGRVGRLLETIPFRRLALRGGPHPLESELDIDGDRWFVHGWFERDLATKLDELFPSAGDPA